jgi:hypothetical protein
LVRNGSGDKVVGDETRPPKLVLESYLPSKTLQERIVSMVSRLTSESATW